MAAGRAPLPEHPELRAIAEAMEVVAVLARRAASILFADLEASGEIRRRISSRTYFDLVRGLTDLIDTQVIAQGGIVGKHAGDGASALFLVEQLGHSEFEAAGVAIHAARSIRDRASELPAPDPDVRIDVGVHSGATLMIRQVATGGCLEFAGFGDEMNEAAPIQDVATGGTALASKSLMERLDADHASELGLDLDGLSYTTVGTLAASSAKPVRDAGTIPVAPI